LGVVLELVEEGVAAQAGEGGGVDVSDLEVGVEAGLEGGWGGAGVFHGEGEFQALRDGDLVVNDKSAFAGGEHEAEGDRAIACGGGLYEVPAGGAGVAVGWEAVAVAEPGEDERDAAADGFVGLVEAFRAEEKEGGFAGFLEMGDVCSVEVDLRFAPRRADVEFRQAALAGGEGDVAGDF